MSSRRGKDCHISSGGLPISSTHYGTAWFPTNYSSVELKPSYPLDQVLSGLFHHQCCPSLARKAQVGTLFSVNFTFSHENKPSALVRSQFKLPVSSELMQLGKSNQFQKNLSKIWKSVHNAHCLKKSEIRNHEKSRSSRSWSLRPLLKGKAKCQCPVLQAPRAVQKLIMSASRSCLRRSCNRLPELQTPSNIKSSSVTFTSRHSWNRKIASNHFPAWSQAPRAALYANKFGWTLISFPADTIAGHCVCKQEHCCQVKLRERRICKPSIGMGKSGGQEEGLVTKEVLVVLHFCQQVKRVLPLLSARCNTRSVYKLHALGWRSKLAPRHFSAACVYH